MTAVASAVVAVAVVTGVVTEVSGPRGERESAAPEVSGTPLPVPPPAVSSAPAPPASGSPSPSSSETRPEERVEKARPTAEPTRRAARAAPAPLSDARLYRHPESQVLDWVGANPGDPRQPLIKSRIADRPAAVWFAEYNPGAITARVREVTSGAAAQGRVPVVVPYTIPERDCGGASQGGAPGYEAYDAWMRNFAAGLGSGEVVVILEPDSVALADCLSAGQRSARFASLARAGRTIHAANPRARVYFDGGHSGWHAAAQQADALRAAGASSSGDGIFTNVSNFHTTADEVAYAQRVLAELGGPARLGAVIDTSRNGNGPPAAGQWCDPADRALGRAPTTATGQARIDAYLWVKLPGESDGCRGRAGAFTPDYAYDLARG
ncbi:glycoside hydrolase family 6 protein [Streptomyces sp. GC420]|uniref:glycoside hydrolase family 6 protein n=1 Tax=Streptomyces sp. GC420 TaxID=2697568 RepID=UPI00141519D7|nr:glycoside hydrolase family 6 protein [Streptomyces sp. GC420]NBM19288.1 endoglucanase [Streptomyces sp. GC420]